MTGVTATLSVFRAPADISVSPVGASGTGITPSIVTNSVTVSSVPAGSAWAWEYVSGGSFITNSPSSATTTWTASGMAPGEERSAIYRCAVTIGGSVYYSPDVGVDAARAS